MAEQSSRGSGVGSVESWGPLWLPRYIGDAQSLAFVASVLAATGASPGR